MIKRLRKFGLLAVLFLLCATPAQSVELLVQSQKFWQRSEPIPEGTTQDTIAWLRDMWHQTHRGEIIVIKPDGWQWGKLESPPRFIVIKIPGDSVAQAMKYTQGLVDSLLFDRTIPQQPDTVDVKERRWYVIESIVGLGLMKWREDSLFVVLTPAQTVGIIKEYDLAAIKQKIRDKVRR